MPTSRGLVRTAAFVFLVLLLSPSIVGISGAESSASNRDGDGSCMATAHCPPAPHCLSHCSTVLSDDSPTPLASAVTSARAMMGQPTHEAATVDVHKPPPRPALLG